MFLSKEDSLNGEFWGPDVWDDYNEPIQKQTPEVNLNDNLKSDEF